MPSESDDKDVASLEGDVLGDRRDAGADSPVAQSGGDSAEPVGRVGIVVEEEDVVIIRWRS